MLRTIPKRPPCSDAERRAALLLHDRLRERGHEVWVETYWVRPQAAGELLLHAGLGIAASLAATAAPYPALGVALFAALSYALGLLRLLFVRRATQAVVVEPRDPERVALLVAAATDSPRGGRWVSKPWVVLALLWVAAAAAARAAGAEGPAVGAPQFVPTLFLLLAAAAALDTALSTIRADDGAAAAAAIDLLDELAREDLANLSPGLVLANPHGLRAHLRRERRRREDTVLVELRGGEGSPVYGTRHPQLRAACDWTRAELPALQAQPGSERGPRGIPRLIVSGDAVEFAATVAGVLDADLGVRPFPEARS